ncbi:MAG: hypothetical protein R3195_05695 [Gemmatimonadota bacterium]|nr:hypothetical protein [Gemmatimonadota bacterium]
MSSTDNSSVWISVEHTASLRQRRFMRYFTGALVDLVVLGLFAEYWDAVTVDGFTIALLAAVLLQVLLKLTIIFEHWVAGFFKAMEGGFAKFLRIFCAWLVLFGSKFVILEALDVAFGDRVQFHGVFHGLLTLILVVVVMLVVEALIVKLYRRLA